MASDADDIRIDFGAEELHVGADVFTFAFLRELAGCEVEKQAGRIIIKLAAPPQPAVPDEDRQTCPSRVGSTFPNVERADHWRRGACDIRTCSFCGGLHPDDAVLLLREGCGFDRTTKPYKGYIMPNGKYAALPSMMKFYTDHFSPEQLAELNAAIKGA